MTEPMKRLRVDPAHAQPGDVVHLTGRVVQSFSDPDKPDIRGFVALSDERRLRLDVDKLSLRVERELAPLQTEPSEVGTVVQMSDDSYAVKLTDDLWSWIKDDSSLAPGAVRATRWSTLSFGAFCGPVPVRVLSTPQPVEETTCPASS